MRRPFFPLHSANRPLTLLLLLVIALTLTACASMEQNARNRSQAAPFGITEVYPIFTTETQQSIQPMIDALAIAFPGAQWEIRNPEAFDPSDGFPGYDFAIVMLTDESADRFGGSGFADRTKWEDAQRFLGRRDMIATDSALWNNYLAAQTLAYNRVPSDRSAYEPIADAVREAAARLPYAHPLVSGEPARLNTPAPAAEESSRVPDWLAAGEDIFLTLEEDILIVYSTRGLGELPLARIHMEEITNDEGEPGFKFTATDLSDGVMSSFFATVVDLAPTDYEAYNMWSWNYVSPGRTRGSELEIFRDGLTATRLRVVPGRITHIPAHPNSRHGEIEAESHSSNTRGSVFSPAWASVHRNRQPPEAWYADDNLSDMFLDGGTIYARHRETGEEQPLAYFEYDWSPTQTDGTVGELTVTIREEPGLGIIGGWFRYSTANADWVDPTHPRGGGNVVQDVYRFDLPNRPGWDVIGRDGDVTILSRKPADAGAPIRFRNLSMSIRFPDGTVREFDL